MRQSLSRMSLVTSKPAVALAWVLSFSVVWSWPSSAIAISERQYSVKTLQIAERFRRQADTVAQSYSKELDKLAMQADTLEAAAAKRKGKAVPFGGEIDPFKHQEDTLAAANTLYMPKQGSGCRRVSSSFRIIGHRSRSGFGRVRPRSCRLLLRYIARTAGAGCRRQS